MSATRPHSLRAMVSNLLFVRLLIPLLAAGALLLTAGIFAGKRDYDRHQAESVDAAALKIEAYVDRGRETLDILAMQEAVSEGGELSAVLSAVLAAHPSFDVIYRIGSDGRVEQAVPADAGYVGLDLSRITAAWQNAGSSTFWISPPWMSIRTGEPTVSLMRRLPDGGGLVAELRLGMLQQEVLAHAGKSDRSTMFILDMHGTVIAHPDSVRVRERANEGGLEIFRRTGPSAQTPAVTAEAGATGGSSVVGARVSGLLYRYDGTWVLGSAARMLRTGWVVVCQDPVSVFVGMYALSAALLVFVSVAFWMALVWNLNHRLRIQLVAPLEALNRDTRALMLGDVEELEGLVENRFSSEEIYAFAKALYGNAIVQKRLLASLERMTAHYGAIIGSSGDFIWSVDRECRIVTLNAPFRDHYLRVRGIAAEAGMPLEALDPKLVEACRSVLDGAASRSEAFALDGGIWIEASFHPIFREHAVHEIACFGRDVTARLQAEQERERFSAELERRIEERTAELQKSLEDIRTFSYSMSHDLKSPLRHIEACCDFILEDHGEALPADAGRLIGVIRGRSRGTIQFIDRLLLYFRISRHEKHFEMVDMQRMVEASFEQERYGHPGRRIELRIAEPLPLVVGDRFLLGQAIGNILSNAVKFTRDRDPAVIEVSFSSAPEGLLFRFSDNGAGFDPAFSDKLFLIFQRLHSQEEFEGSGIGLVTVRSIVEAHGGRVWIEGEPERGCVLSMLLPVRTDK